MTKVYPPYLLKRINCVLFTSDLFRFYRMLAGEPQDSALFPILFNVFSHKTPIHYMSRLHSKRATWLWSQQEVRSHIVLLVLVFICHHSRGDIISVNSKLTFLKFILIKFTFEVETKIKRYYDNGRISSQTKNL